MQPRRVSTKGVKTKAEDTLSIDYNPLGIPKNTFIGAPIGQIFQRMDYQGGGLEIDRHRITFITGYVFNSRSEIPKSWRLIMRALKVHYWKENVFSKLGYFALEDYVPLMKIKWAVDQKSPSLTNLRNLRLTIKGSLQTVPSSETDDMLGELMSVISRNFTKLTSLSLSLEYLKITTTKEFEDAIFLIAKQLPNLAWLNIKIAYCWDTSDKSVSIITSKASRYFLKLRGLTLQYDTQETEKLGKMQIFRQNLANLNYLSLHCDWNLVLENFQKFSLKSFNKLSALNHLVLFSRPRTSEIEGMTDSLFGLLISKIFPNLRTLSLDFLNYHLKVQKVQTILASIAENLPFLTGFSLSFPGCDQLTSKEIKAMIAQVCENLPKLTEFHLTFPKRQILFEEIRSYQTKINKNLPLLEKYSLNF